MNNDLIQNPYDIDVIYEFEFDDGSQKRFEVKTNLLNTEVRHYSRQRYKWTEAGESPCDPCELGKDEKFCPAAVSIVDIVEFFAQRTSFSEVTCRVYLDDKTIIVNKPLQDALYPLIGLRLATSQCPLLSKFKPMARFHEPFSTPFGTICKSTAFYLLGQFFKMKHGQSPDWGLKELKEFYGKINIVNSKISERLKKAEIMDAAPNSLMILSLFGSGVAYLFDDFLNTLEPLFETPAPDSL